jgi:type I restriction enzyme S subunit
LALSVGLPDLPSPEGWKWVKLREIAEMATGHTPSRSNSDYWGGDIPWIKAKDARPVDGGIIDDSNEYTNEKGISNSSAVVLPKGTVCLSRTGSIGYSIILGRPMATSQGFVNWICSDAIVPRFLQALFILERPFLEDIAEGSAHETVYLSEAKAFHVCLPPIEEQRRIANRLDAIQSRTQATGETLDQVPDRIKEYRQSVLNAAFTGRLTADWREDHSDVEPAAQLLSGAEDRRTNKYKKRGKLNPVDEGLTYDIPDSWTWSQIGDVASHIRYGTSDKAKYENSGVPMIRMGDIENGQIHFDDLKYMPEGWDDREKFLLEDGDLLFNRTNSAELVGKSAVYKAEHPEAVFASYLVRAKLHEDIFAPDLLASYINSAHGRRYIRAETKQQVGQANVNATKMASMPIPVPPAKEQEKLLRRIKQRLDKINEMAEHVDQADDRLDQLDRSVLAKAFRGELVEAEAERARREDRDYETAEELLKRVEEKAARDTDTTVPESDGEKTARVDENGQIEMKVVDDENASL